MELKAELKALEAKYEALKAKQIEMEKFFLREEIQRYLKKLRCGWLPDDGERDLASRLPSELVSDR